MALLAVLWGLSIPLTKLGLQDTSPTTLTALRFAFAVPPLLLYVIGRHPLPRRAIAQVVGLGVVGIFIGQVAQSLGVAGTSASIGTITSATIPIFIVLFAALRLKQSVTWEQRVGIAAASTGIAVVACGRGGGVEASPEGVGFMLLSSVTIAFYYTVLMLRGVEELSVEEVAAILDIPEATVRSRFFRARGLLREGLSLDMDMALADAFSFAGLRCDKIVTGVLATIARERASAPT